MSGHQPTFSVVIPTRDRFAQLATCLAALAEQDYAHDAFDVIVVNDASDQAVPAEIEAFADRITLTIINQPTPTGPGIARNNGADRATGRFVAFTDDDCAAAPDWLAKLAVHFAETPDQLVGGRVINALRQNPYATASHIILDVVYDYYDPRQGRAHFFPTSNFALPRNRFSEIGGFSAGWPLAAAEDREFCFQWLQHGWPMSHAREAIVYHRHDLGLSSFCQLHFKYGRGAYHYHRLRVDKAGAGGLRPDWGFYWSCLSYAWRRFPKSQTATLVALLGLWQFSNAAGYFWQRSQKITPRLTRPTSEASHSL